MVEEASIENFDFSIMAVFASLVFDISTQVGVQRQKLETSGFWNKNSERLNKGLNGVRKASLQAILLSLLIIIATAIGMSLPMSLPYGELEERMKLILEGLSLLFAAVMFGKLSCQVALWTGLYYKAWKVPELETSRSLKEVELKARWSYYRIFTRYYFFLMPFYQGVNAVSVQASMLSGIGVGLFVDFCVFLARRRMQKIRRFIVLALIALFVSASSILLLIGVYFIVKVWEQAWNPEKDEWIPSLSFLICLFVETMVHIFRWWFSRRKFKKETAIPASVPRANRPRMVMSLFLERVQKSQHETVMMTALGDEDDSSSRSSEDPDLEELDLEEPDSGKPEHDPEASECAQDKSEFLQNNDDDKEEEVYETPSYRQMFCSYWTCCGCVRGDDWSAWEKAWSFLSWTVWYALVGFSLWLVIVNLGATVQQENAREKLPFVHKKIYASIDDGPVCAFDNKGAHSNITTFDNKDAAHAEGFLVLHCDKCGACSDWNNLRLEFTT